MFIYLMSYIFSVYYYLVLIRHNKSKPPLFKNNGGFTMLMNLTIILLITPVLSAVPRI